MNKKTKKATSWLLLHVFGAFLFLQWAPTPARAALDGDSLSALTPLLGCNDPLATVSNQLVPNLMILVDTSGSMEEDATNAGLRLGADDPRSKLSILKRALQKLVVNNSEKINIGLAAYNQQTYGGNPVILQYDFDFLYANAAFTMTTTADPTTDPAPAGIIRDSAGQYYYDANSSLVYEPGTDYVLVGPYIPYGNYTAGLLSGNYGSFSWLWTLSPEPNPGCNSNYNENPPLSPPSPAGPCGSATPALTYWHAHDDDFGGPAGLTDPYLDSTYTLVGAFVNNDWFYNDFLDEHIDSEPAGSPTMHRLHRWSGGLQIPDEDNQFDNGWHRYTSIDTTGVTTASNPSLTTTLSLMNPQVYSLKDEAGETADWDNPDLGNGTGLIARGATPLFQSMEYAYEYFLRLTGSTSSVSRWATPTDPGMGAVASDAQSFFSGGCRKNYILLITDGKHNDGTGTPAGYPDAFSAIDDIMMGGGGGDGITDLGVKVLVVGFSLGADGTQQVNRIAYDSDMDRVDAVFDPTNLEEDAINDERTYNTLTGTMSDIGNPDGISDPFIATNEPQLLSSLEAAFAAVASGSYVSSSPVLGTNVDVISGHSSSDRYGNSPAKVNQNVLALPYTELPIFKGHLKMYELFDYNSSGQVVIPSPSPTLLWDAGNRTTSRSLVLTSTSTNTGNLVRHEFLPEDVLPPGGDDPGTVFGMTNADYDRLVDAGGGPNYNMEAGNTFETGFNDDDWGKLIRWVRDSYGLETGPAVGAMGAPIMASPAVVGPPMQEPPPDSDYVEFSNTWYNRATVVYQPADDGMIHAIVAGPPSGTASITWNNGYGSHAYFGGEELWAYIPHGILNNLVKFDTAQASDYPPGDVRRFSTGSGILAEQSTVNHRFFINGDVVIGDVKLDDVSTGAWDPSWRTIIMGGYGPGNEGFWCIDITNPTDPIQLWDTDTSWTSAERATLGLTYSTPRVGKIKIIDPDDPSDPPQIKWVAFAGSGYHEGRESSSEDTPSDSRGRTFYIIDLADGDLLYQYTTNDIATTTTQNKLVGSVATVDENYDGYTDSAFIGDLEGRTWKFAMDNANGTVEPTVASPAVQYFFDDDPVLTAADLDAGKSMVAAGNSGSDTGKQPLVSAPSVTIQYYSDGTTSGYAPLAFFGTGGNGTCTTMAAGEFNFIDGFIDPDQLTEITPRGKRFCLGSIPLVTLSQNEQLVGTPVVLGTRAYITTFKKDSSNPCSSGQGFAYIVDFGDCLTASGYSTGLPASDLMNLAETQVAPGGGTSLGEGMPGGIAAGAGGVYVIGETGSVYAIQGGAGPDNTGTCDGCINPQKRVGVSGQAWREEER